MAHLTTTDARISAAGQCCCCSSHSQCSGKVAPIGLALHNVICTKKELFCSYKQAEDVQTVVKGNNIFCASPTVTLRLLCLRSRNNCHTRHVKKSVSDIQIHQCSYKDNSILKRYICMIEIQRVDSNTRLHSQQYRSCCLLISSSAVGEGAARS